MSGLERNVGERASLLAAVAAAAAIAAIPAAAVTTAATATATPTAAAATTTTATAAATPVAAASAAAAAVATATATTTTEAAATGTGRALFTRTGDVHREGTALDLVTVKFVDAGLGLFAAAHRHERKTARTAGELVEDDLDDTDGANLAEQGLKILRGAGEGKVSHVELVVF